MTLGAASSNHTLTLEAFRGCLVHFLINDLPTTTTAKMQTNNAGRSATQSMVEEADYSCRNNEVASSTLISFPTTSAFLEVEHKDSTKNFLDISMDFRTFESDGLLLYQGTNTNHLLHSWHFSIKSLIKHSYFPLVKRCLNIGIFLWRNCS